MSEILISIRPEFVEKILSGEKTVELRRTAPLDLRKMHIYCTRPVSRVVATATIAHVFFAPPRVLWDACHDCCGIDRERFDAYFSGCSTAYGLVISRLQKVTPYRIKAPPQSWRYVNS